MKIGYHMDNPALAGDPRFRDIVAGFEAGGVEVYRIQCRSCVQQGTDMVLSIGGDGTFLSTTHLVSEAGIPILGVNFGRMGFLSENSPENVVAPVLEGKYFIEDRAMLQVTGFTAPGFWPYALNEVSLNRLGAEMLGIDVSVDGNPLPTYWADGLLVASSSGSTAYNLSAGGPICTPDSKVMLITPVAPHNLGLRPLVVSPDKTISLSGQSRSGQLALSLDNRTYEVPAGTEIRVGAAPFCLRRVNLRQHSFIDALRIRFFWGQDVRNMPE